MRQKHTHGERDTLGDTQRHCESPTETHTHTETHILKGTDTH